MPPKVKVSKEDIIRASIDLVRQEGAQAINARTIASKLNCSTQPIFSNFSTMDDLQKEVNAAAHAYYLTFLQSDAESGKYPEYKAYGMAYIRFAKEERELFKMLFMCDRNGEGLVPTADWEISVNCIMQAYGVSRETADIIHMEMWAFVHGIATMLATSFLNLDEDFISNMMTDVYQGSRTLHRSKEEAL